MIHIIKKSEFILDAGSEKFNFENFINFMLNDNQFNTTLAGLRSANNISEALNQSKNKSEIKLETDDYTKLLKAAEEPSMGYPLKPAYKCLPWIDAIKTATKVE